MPDTVKVFLTPQESDGKRADKVPSSLAKRRYLDGVIQEQENGKLNPVWV